MHAKSFGDDTAAAVETSARRSLIAERIARYVGSGAEADTPIDGLTLYRLTEPAPATSHLYEPSLSMIVQGSKRVTLGEKVYQYRGGEFLLTAVDLPTVTQVVEASDEEPYVSILMKLDLAAAKQIIGEVDLAGEPSVPGFGMQVGAATPALFDALGRLLDLLDEPGGIPVLGALIQREFLYRVLTGPAGARLREIVRVGTQGNRVARAVGWLRDNYRDAMRVDDLARLAGMGVSTLHHHFRALTAMSPVQYQKHLRLHEARRLMLVDEVDAGSASLQVGYESATQFSREYRRMFGSPPARDMKRLRVACPGQPAGVRTA
jgi:AraC-like DNA-binding protein